MEEEEILKRCREEEILKRCKDEEEFLKGVGKKKKLN